MDIDLVMKPESDAVLRAIPALKERLHLNIEIAAPNHFIPVPAGWEDRSPVVAQIGSIHGGDPGHDASDRRPVERRTRSQG